MEMDPETMNTESHIKLAMSGEAFSRELTLKKTLEFTRMHGIRYFELWAQNCESNGGSLHPRLFVNRDIQKTFQLFNNFEVQVACVAFGGAFHQEIVADETLYVNELIRAIEIAEKLNARFVNHYVNLISPQVDIDFDILDRYFSKPIKRAEELGIVLVLENEAHDVTHSPENVLTIIRHFNSDHFKANFDVTNFYQASNEAFPYAYQVLKDDIRYVHIKNGCLYHPDAGHQAEWKGGQMSGYHSAHSIYYTLPDQGAVNVIGLINRLKQDHYNGFLTLEPHSTLKNVMAYYEIAIPLMQILGIE
jgi:sugar phosphate isomerase/epimerase